MTTATPIMTGATVAECARCNRLYSCPPGESFIEIGERLRKAGWRFAFDLWYCPDHAR